MAGCFENDYNALSTMAVSSCGLSSMGLPRMLLEFLALDTAAETSPGVTPSADNGGTRSRGSTTATAGSMWACRLLQGIHQKLRAARIAAADDAGPAAQAGRQLRHPGDRAGPEDDTVGGCKFKIHAALPLQTS